jgi:hypothetical protein
LEFRENQVKTATPRNASPGISQTANIRVTGCRGYRIRQV